MNNKNTHSPIHNLISNSKGRFFGLYTNSGRRYNAQLVRETPETYLFLDNNSGDTRRIKKTSVQAVVMSGVRTEA